MNKPNLLLATSTFNKSKNEFLEKIINKKFNPIYNPNNRKLTEKELIQLLINNKINYVVAGLEPYNSNVLKNTNLKIISRLGSGISNVDTKTTKSKKIKVHVNDIKKKNYFYYSIFLDIELKKKLINFHKKTQKNSIKKKFIPHLSLIYSNNKTLKIRIFKEIKDNNNFKNMSFFCDRVAFIRFNEIKEEWKIIKLFKLTSA